MQQPSFIPGIAQLALRFDGFILDLWGVLHDGTHPYPGAIDALAQLHAAGKTIILLSNAPRQSHKVQQVLDTIGFPRTHYDHILTSGEAARNWLIDAEPYGEAYYYIGPPKDQDLLVGTRYREVKDPANADFTLLTGFDEFGDGMETKLPQVEASLAANLPLVCANPDRRVVKQDGRVMLCAGLLAEWYVEHGGKVEWFGKPYPAVYEQCLKMFNTSRICAIGDSLHTDVAGARGMSLYSVLCAGGILAETLGIDSAGMPARTALDKLCAEERVAPDAVIPSFRW